jgi:peptidoglycan/xylan/chitin deacetylase (PgdA/CDA1 family)
MPSISFLNPPADQHRPRRRAVTVAAALLCLLLLAAPARAGAAQTVVSLTFDDGTATEYQTRTMLAGHGMHATFYINSSQVGTSDYYMTWPQIHDLYADGNEIAGHTAHHVNLPQIDQTEAKREICKDRNNLLDQGFDVRNFAYPYGSFNSTIEQLVRDCGYNSARTTNDTTAETIPPADPYAIRTGTSSGDLTTLKNTVLAAERAGGGWVPIIFHQVCNACDGNWILPADLQAFLDWLQPRAANGTVVKTVGEVVGGAVQPAVAPPAPPPAPNGFNVVRNASLEADANADGIPDCFRFDSWGSNNFTWSRTHDAHTGSWGERVDVSNYTNGDNKLVVDQDLGFCTPTVTPGHRYRVTAWYKSNQPVFLTAFSRNSLGSFAYWTSSGNFSASSTTWTQATWVTPVIPAGVDGLSFGLTLGSSGFLTVDDLAIDDAAATGGNDTTAPTVTLTSPASNATVTGPVSLSADATDDTAVDHVDFLVDGATVTTLASGPYTYSWNSRTVSNGFHTISARAVDISGNAKATTPITVYVSNSFTNVLKNPSLETATGSNPDCWTLGGYGINTFAWTRTSDAHSGSFAEELDVTGYTNGDRKLVSTQDSGTCAPAATAGHTYTFTGWYKTTNDPNMLGTQPIVYAFYRNSAGVWTYWAQSPKLPTATSWTQGLWTTPAVPAGATAISVGFGLNAVGSITVDDLSLIDNAPPPDTTAPTSTIQCNDGSDAGGCFSGYYGGTVQVSLSASDNPGGSGVDAIRYTTDGSDPTATTGTVFAGPFSVTSTSTIKYRAFDKAGNAEAVHSQVVRIDTTPPTSAIACDGTDCSSDFYNHSVSVSLSATDAGGSSVAQIRYTTDGTDPTTSTGKQYVGAFSLSSSTTVKYRAFDEAGNAEAVQSKLVKLDTIPPTSAITCNAQPCTSNTYTSPVEVALQATDEPPGSGGATIRYTTDGSDPTSSNGTVYSAPFSLSATTTVKYRAIDNAGNAETVNTQLVHVADQTSISLTSPTSGSTVTGTITLAAQVTDAPADHVDFLVDGNVVGTTATAPYTRDWDSTTVADGSHTITARAVDASGDNVLASDSASVTVLNQAGDTTPPSSTISCNDAACSSGYYGGAVSVRLAATDDSGGSGVAMIRYTLDGSTPTATTGTQYTGSFSVATTTTVKYRAFDNAGNAEAVNSKDIRIDSVAPSSTIACNGTDCASTYYTAAVSVALAASDSGGSGVDAIRYTTDGSTPTSSNGTLYTQPFSLTSTTTVKYRAFDSAGNAEAVDSALIRIDTTPPSSALKCDGQPCTSGYYKADVSLSLSADDADSGVQSIRYTLDGTDPTATTGTVYDNSFGVSGTTTVKYRAFDKVGNAEAVASKLIHIDATAPTVSLTDPSSGAGVTGSTTLKADASDDIAVDHVDFLVDGQQVGVGSTAPFAFDWSSASVADGAHTIAARAVDSAGNTKTSSSVSVYVRNNNLLKNASLETASGSTPTCWTLGGYGTNTFAWTRTSDAHSGSFAEALSVSDWTNGDRKLVSTQDTGACAPSVVAGRTYTVTVYYKSPNRPVIYAYYRNSSGSWVYWAQSSGLASATSFTQASWHTPAVPAGATAVSVGLGLNALGSLTMDDFGLFSDG